MALTKGQPMAVQ
ncbi:hypothetical protein VCHC69A1_0989A, partial [Vibrio cholerae HC-69A1]